MRSVNTDRNPDADYVVGDMGDWREKSPEEIAAAWDKFSNMETDVRLMQDRDVDAPF